MAQLREYEPIYKAKKLMSSEQQALKNQSHKRTLHMTGNDQIDDKEDAMDSWLFNWSTKVTNRLSLKKKFGLHLMRFAINA